MSLNKNRLCPLADTGMPTGEVWVARRPAKIPFTVIDMGTGPEGLTKLRTANRTLDQLTPAICKANAVRAFNKGEGHLLDDLKANKIESIYRPGNDLTLKPTTKNTIVKRLKGLFRAIWDSANLSD